MLSVQKPSDESGYGVQTFMHERVFKEQEQGL